MQIKQKGTCLRVFCCLNKMGCGKEIRVRQNLRMGEHWNEAAKTSLCIPLLTVTTIDSLCVDQPSLALPDFSEKCLPSLQDLTGKVSIRE